MHKFWRKKLKKVLGAEEGKEREDNKRKSKGAYIPKVLNDKALANIRLMPLQFEQERDDFYRNG